ncbi:tetratricopeptide repeat protein [Pelagicoccus mobilis]|uniref:Sel1 repeat family protein n=1 Tax=Pelagicoccus mobilis TaxID=415221 RepID=A0A934RX12_9BACT|nr:tetratricopeptide repeat protein [Pelagicoccus mobilis]MBK1877888.1 sel1 repeat family protein [Pelagicoccus mobilis]
MKKIRILLLSLVSLAIFSHAQAKEAPDQDAMRYQFDEAMAELGGGDEATQKAVALKLKKLAVAGHGRSQYWLAQLYFEGIGVGQNVEQGKLWIQRAAESGYPIAMLAYAEILIGEVEGDEEPDYQTLKSLLEGTLSDAAAAGLSPEEFGIYRRTKARANYLLGLLYQNGWGVEEDLVRAMQLMEKGSRTGSKDASMALAIAYAKGEGVERDVEKAKTFFDLFDLQSADEANRSIEGTLGMQEDRGDRENMIEASELIGESITQMVYAMQTQFATEVLDEESEDFDAEFAATLLGFAAEGGYLEAKLRLGLLHYRGLGVEKDLAKAADYFASAAKEDWVLAQYNWAAMLRAGEAQSEGKRYSAESLFEKAADSGLYAAQVALDDKLSPVSPLSPEEASSLCIEQADAGDARAIYSLALRKTSGWLVDVEPDFSKVISLYEKSAEDGYKRAQFVIGAMKLSGEGVAFDPLGGIAYIKDAAYQGLPEATYTLAECKLKGLGVSQDPFDAYELFKKAARLGFTNAYNRVAAFHYYGITVPKNEYKAAELYLYAADEGDAEAAQNLGNCYLRGIGVKMSTREGIRWISKSAELGNLVSCYHLANIYRENLLVDQDLVEVAYWFERAAELGDKMAMRETALNYFLGRGHPRNRGKAAQWLEMYLVHPAPITTAALYFPGEYETNAVLEKFRPDDYSAMLMSADLMAEKEWSGTNRKEARKLYESMASKGAQGAKLRLARMYRDDDSSSKDAKRAISYFKSLYDGNHDESYEGMRHFAAEAAYELSVCYADGYGVKASESQRVHWLEESARLDKVEAQFELGSLLAAQTESSATRSAGTNWLLKAAEHGDHRSQLAIARLNLESPVANVAKGVVVDWLKALVDDGSGEARVLLRKYGVRYKEIERRQPSPQKEEKPVDPWAPIGAA